MLGAHFGAPSCRSRLAAKGFSNSLKGWLGVGVIAALEPGQGGLPDNTFQAVGKLDLRQPLIFPPLADEGAFEGALLL